MRTSILFGCLWAISTVQQSVLAAGPGSPANWLLPTSGNWNDATKWSTSVFPNNGSPNALDTYNVVLDASGAAHTVSLQDDISLDSLTIDSPDATFLHTNGILTANVITINQGIYQFGSDDGGSQASYQELVGAIIIGNGGEFRVGSRDRPAQILRDVVLDIDVTVPTLNRSPARPSLTIEEGLTIAVDRTLSIDRNNAILQVNGTQTIDGEGEIVFINNSGTSLGSGGSIDLSEGTTLTIGPSITVRADMGRGSIGKKLGEITTNPNVAIINRGLISSSIQDRTMEIFNVEPTATATFVNEGIVEAVGNGKTIVGGDWTNLGTFRIRDNGILRLAGNYQATDIGTIDRQGGEVHLTGIFDNRGNVFTSNATTGSVMLGESISVATSITGGTFDAIDGTIYQLRNSRLTDVTLAAEAEVTPGERLFVFGDITLDDGTIRFLNPNFDSPADFSFRETAAPQRILGKGLIDLTNAGRIEISIGNELIIAPDVVVQSPLHSDGQFLDGKLTSQGTLLVPATSHLELAVDEFINEGTLDVTGAVTIGRNDNMVWRNDGEIRLRPGSVINLDGSIRLSDLGNFIDEGASLIRLRGTLDNRGQVLDVETLNWTVPLTLGHARIIGGTIVSTGPEHLILHTGGQDPGIFDGVTLANDLVVPGIVNRLDIANGISLDDITLTMQESTHLRFIEAGPQTLEGTGTIFVQALANTFGSTHISGERLIIGENITIRNGLQPDNLVELQFQENRGTIISEAPGFSRVLISAVNDGESWKNTGLIRALAGVVEFTGTYKTSDIGNVEVAGGKVLLTGTIDNVGQTLVQNDQTGSWTLHGYFYGGRIESSGNALPILGERLFDLTLSGRAQIGDGIANGSAHFVNRLTLDRGLLNIFRGTSLLIDGPLQIDGQGTIFLDGTLGSPARLQILTNGALTIGPDVTIQTGPQGSGQIGDADRPVINYGTISAQTARQRIIVDGAFENFGLLEFKNGATLLVESSEWTNRGTMRVHPSGSFRVASTDFENGVDGTIEGAGSFTITDPAVLNRGTISPGNSIGSLVVSANLEFAPTSLLRIELGQNGASDLLSVNGNVSLGGALDILLDPSFDRQLGKRYEILRASIGQVSGVFVNAADSIQVGRMTFDVEYTTKGVFLTTTAIPEPNGLLMTCVLATVMLICSNCRNSSS